MALHSAAGTLKASEAKRAARATRTGTVGPISLFYAGATASVVTAGMGALGSAALLQLYPPSPWTELGSVFAAALGGLVWFSVFLRWGYRHGFGRAEETELPCRLEAGKDGLIYALGAVETRIPWEAVRSARRMRGLKRMTLLGVRGHRSIAVPDGWFSSGAESRAFWTYVTSQIDAGAGEQTDWPGHPPDTERTRPESPPPSAS